VEREKNGEGGWVGVQEREKKGGKEGVITHVEKKRGRHCTRAEMEPSAVGHVVNKTRNSRCVQRIGHRFEYQSLVRRGAWGREFEHVPALPKVK
jgi:hypothetical protein